MGKSNRPLKSSAGFCTVELGQNKSAGEYGSVEIVVSWTDREDPVVHYWPLSSRGTLSPAQMADLTALVAQLLTDALFLRISVQTELFLSP